METTPSEHYFHSYSMRARSLCQEFVFFFINEVDVTSHLKKISRFNLDLLQELNWLTMGTSVVSP